MNQIKVEGNLTKDAHYSATPSGVRVLKFSVADNKNKKNSAGKWETVGVMFFNCTIFGEKADELRQLKKGTKVAVTGRFEYSEYTSKKDGKQKPSLEIFVSDLSISQRGAKAPAKAAPSYSDMDDTIPF